MYLPVPFFFFKLIWEIVGLSQPEIFKPGGWLTFGSVAKAFFYFFTLCRQLKVSVIKGYCPKTQPDCLKNKKTKKQKPVRQICSRTCQPGLRRQADEQRTLLWCDRLPSLRALHSLSPDGRTETLRRGDGPSCRKSASSGASSDRALCTRPRCAVLQC